MTGRSARTTRRPSPARVVAWLLWSAAMLALGWGWGRIVGGRPEPVTAAAPQSVPDGPRASRLDLRPVTFGELPGWGGDTLLGVLPALRRSCEILDRLPADRPLGGSGTGRMAGTLGDWRPICAALSALPAGDPASGIERLRVQREVRFFFESRFRPFAVSDHGAVSGLFTGYYEPTLEGSRRRSRRFRVPLYLRPHDLVSVDLGRFRDDLAGRRIAGRLEGSTLVPYHDRASIDHGALAGRGLELVWVDDPVDAFFLHIQGSGRIELAEGGSLRVGYAGQNGHPYVAIGRTLVERGELSLGEVSMQSIRDWLDRHPDEAEELLHQNPSYVFFRRLPGEGPVGSQGAVLTPGRSLAVDRDFLPLGVPVWLDTRAPAAGRPGIDRPLHRLLIAQDTGGAIRGPVRGDVYWGPGEEAADIAGRMRSRGRMWVLLPR